MTHHNNIIKSYIQISLLNMRNEARKSLPISNPTSISIWISNFIAKPIQNKKQILTQMLCEYNWFVDLHKQLYIKSPNELNQYSKCYNMKKNNQLIKLDMTKKIQKISKRTFTSQDQCVDKNQELMSTSRSLSNYDPIKAEEYEHINQSMYRQSQGNIILYQQINNKLKQTQQQLLKKNNQINQLQQQKANLINLNKKKEGMHRNLKDKVKKILVDMKKQLNQLKIISVNINDKTLKISQMKAQTNIFMKQQLKVYNQLLKLQKQKIETISKQLKAIQNENTEIKKNQILTQKKKQINQFVNYQQLIFNNPSICFMHSNILPILPVKKQINIDENTQLINFLLNSVNTLYKKTKVKALKPLYSFQNFRTTKVNFHSLVDNIPNLLLIIKLKNKSIIGVYSQSGITQKNPSNKNIGLMCQSVDRKIYLPKQKYDTNPIMRYDEYYINIGNQDILIRIDSSKIESCFNSITSLFRPSSDYNFNNIFHEGPDKDSVQLQDYEFYQIFIF